MFNLSGSEIVFLLLIALIVLGPEKLPEAVRKFGKVYAEAKKMSTGFQSELKSALDEPMREMRETAEAFKNAANLNFDIDADDTTDASDTSDTLDEAVEADEADEPEQRVEADEADQQVDQPSSTSSESQHVADQLDEIEATLAAHRDAVETVDETATE